MDWWYRNKLHWLFLGVIFSICFLASTTAEAIGPNSLECVETGSGIICPDLFCTTNTINCDPDGRQCYCEPQAFGQLGTRENARCEIATGSEIMFTRDENNEVDKIILKGGIWSAMVDMIATTGNNPNSDVDVNEKAVIFRRKGNYLTSDKSVAYYSSKFLASFNIDNLNAYFNNNFGSNIAILDEITTTLKKGGIGMGFFANIKAGSNNGYIYNATFELGEQVCGSHFTGKNEPFFHKMTAIGNTPAKETACVGATAFFSRLVFPIGIRDSFGGGSNPINVERGILNDAQLTRNCVGSQSEKGSLALFFKTHYNVSILDGFVIASNAIVPSETRRPIYQTYSKDTYMGIKFPANESTSSREEKVSQIRDRCSSDCVVNAENTAADLPRFCKSCSYMANLLRTYGNKSFSQILAQELSNGGVNCNIMDASFGNSFSQTEAHTGIANDSVTIDKIRKESHLNRLVPASLVKICDENFANNHERRIRCKDNALTCHVDSVSPNLSGKDVCDFMNQEESFRRARWIFCPIIKTGTNASQAIDRMIDRIFALNSDALDDKTKTVWEKIRNVANIGLAIVIMLIVTSYLTGWGLSNYQIKKALPRILIAAILANLSFSISELLVDLSNIIAQGINNLIENIIGNINVYTSTFESIIFNSSRNILIIAGILAVAFPMLFGVFFGLIGLLVMLSLRQTLFLVLIIIAPLAMIAMATPGMEGLFRKWFKAYSVFLILFPVIQMLYSSSRLTRAVMSNVSLESGFASLIMQMSLNALPFVTIIFTPVVVKQLFQSIGKVAKAANSFIGGASNIAQKASQKTVRNSMFRQNLIDQSANKFSRFLTGDTTDRRRKWEAKNLKRAEKGKKTIPFRSRFDNKVINFLSYNAASGTTSAMLSGYGRDVNAVITEIGDDSALIKAIIAYQSGASLTTGLSNAQLKKYNLLLNSFDNKMHILSAAMPIVLATNGITDRALYRQAFANAERNGVNPNSYLGQAYGIAKKKGDVEVAGYLGAKLGLKDRQLTPSSNIQSASATLSRASQGLRQMIVNYNGNLSAISTTGLSAVDAGIITSLAASGITRRDLLASSVIAESSSTINSTSDTIIKQGLSALVGSGYTINPVSGMVDGLTDHQKDRLNFAARVLEVVNHNQNDNGSVAGGAPNISFKTATGINLNPADNESIVKNHKTDNLPDGWSEDRSINREPTLQDLSTSYAKAITAIQPANWNPKLFDNQRSADTNAGAVTSHEARDAIFTCIGQDIPLSGVTDSKTAHDALLSSGHLINSIARDWNSLAPSLRAHLEAPIVNSIFGSMSSHDVNNLFGVNDLAAAQRIGAAGLMHLLGAEMRDIRR